MPSRYERHKERLMTEQANLGLDFDEMRTILQEFGARQDEPGFACVSAILDVTKELSTSEMWDKLCVPLEFDPDNWHAALNSLVVEKPLSMP